jgi:hypothetical protein
MKCGMGVPPMNRRYSVDIRKRVTLNSYDLGGTVPHSGHLSGVARRSYPQL